MAISQTHFQNAHDFTVNGLNITHANKIIVKNDHDPVSTTLWQHVAAGAIFDSAERFPPAKCHPGTRERVIEKIVEWIENPDPTQRILWIYGPAGSGKSALVHTICERHRDRCGGSFFFSRGLTDRGKGFKLFATLSYQLAIQFPSFRAVLNEALHHDPSLPTKSMEAQLFSLIIQPLLQCPSFPDPSPILIIDGLDECADDQGPDTQSDIITLIAQSLVEHNIPLRILIASRPEFWIRDTFESSPLPGITLSLSLRDDADADKDIRAYLTDGFEKIRVVNKRIMGSVTPPWPPTDIVAHFVYEASGQYIYASTLLKFVGNSSKFSNPLEQLRILTTPGPYRALAFSELDRLYKTILSAYPRWPTMKRVLEGILAGVNSTIIEKFLGVDPTECTLVLDALSPLINVEIYGPQALSHYEQMLEPIYGSLTARRDMIHLCHLSFREFLEDKTRSGTFHVDITDIVEEITRAFFSTFHRNIDQKYAAEPHISWNIGVAAYRHMILSTTHRCLEWLLIPRSETYVDTFDQLVVATTHRLQRLDPDMDVEYPECLVADMEMLDSAFLVPSRESGSTSQATDDKVQELQDAIFRVCTRCIRQLSSYKRFRVTPTLAFLQYYTAEFSMLSIDTVFDLGPTVADVLSTFQQHRYIIHLGTFYASDRPDPPWALCLSKLNKNLGERDWVARGEWRHQCISFMSHRLKLLLNNGDDIRHQEILSCLGKFFDSHDLTDIRSKKYFQNPCNLSILAVMTDFSLWNGRHELAQSEFIVPVLCWFNRQLTNSTTLNLLEDHNEKLAPKMKVAMNQIFEHHYLPQFNVLDIWKFLVPSNKQPHYHRRFIKLRVLPLPQGCYPEEVHYVPEQGSFLTKLRWRKFHNEVFGTTPQTRDGPTTIDHQRWHPYLACYLLDPLAKAVFVQTNDQFMRGAFANVDETYDDFPYITLIHCLPYAETTQQNLDSLRAIVYLCPKTIPKEDWAMEFCSLSMEFLKKYDRSILSEEELKEFEKRLQVEASSS